uniref:Uncharacterized protein n=1 Tax=Strigamia maritima TaxID=126957 RepID=T1J9M2_STRMM
MKSIRRATEENTITSGYHLPRWRLLEKRRKLFSDSVRNVRSLASMPRRPRIKFQRRHLNYGKFSQDRITICTCYHQGAVENELWIFLFFCTF